MKAMILEHQQAPLVLSEIAKPVAGPGQIVVRVLACGVCRTDLHVVDGDLKHPKLPLVPGHEVVGRVETIGAGVSGFAIGERVGIPWLGHVCGHCAYCREGRENLCDTPGFTGYDIDGGYAEFARAEADYCFHLPGQYSDVEAAPLLCAGLIGYRSFRMAGPGRRLGLYGFGAAAHIIAQVAVAEGREIYAFTSPGDVEAQEFARRFGAVWAGGSTEVPPELLDAAIIFAPVGALVPAALRVLRKGGRVVCAGIHMSDIPAFPYEILWEERQIMSVANLTRQDGLDFMALAGRTKIVTQTTPYPLERANEALADLRSGRLEGAAVLLP
ncbi:zinc-dependent alcohol dehydrogenase family protein [Kaistia dalseonensis]|uniref:alcohol dehydrogenase n=1 Tax=Kaistia dalseonensis TaxID=410840 RepID=A0ABU0HCI8_9HYPH|nr:zinc-dependent alcohol dehydrogenase family protein [Kaistia dalseonensis]MCX5497393.1 zinc-dependent alcohol dehydrogenase family protein [Kaistia dalseonensis]MDQ0440032.1 propanol-preferring alcohol dehydrogenase [Kaistia dalseonensis]